MDLLIGISSQLVLGNNIIEFNILPYVSVCGMNKRLARAACISADDGETCACLAVDSPQ